MLIPSVLPSVVDRAIWKACAGSSVTIPKLNSTVYFYPQGYMEHSSSPILISRLSQSLLSKQGIPCRVSAVNYLADPITDEVFLDIHLVPIEQLEEGEVEEEDADEETIVSYVKVLNSFNVGGFFTIPRLCDEMVSIPERDVSITSITDVHGVAWSFSYRSQLNVALSGWSIFVKEKKLVAGDSLVFTRNTMGAVSVGVRREVEVNSIHRAVDMNKQDEFSRSGYGRVPMETVVEACERAAGHMPFQVVYYPRTGWPQFVVSVEAVKEALSVSWSPGTMVKMTGLTGTEFLGTILSIAVPSDGLWNGSAWRMLRIAWDEREIMGNSKKWLSPWEVKHVDAAPASTLDGYNLK